MAKFPKTPTYTGAATPLRFEVDVYDLEAEGDIPADLDGAFVRVQPDPQFPPKLGDDIMFNGDGAVSQFRFKDGRAHFKHRWVRTDKWKLEHAAGKALFGAYRNPLGDDPSVKGKYRGTANTNVLYHGGNLFALKEDSPPVAMDPTTLETKGYWDFGGTMKSPTFTAHPKIDPKTGEMVCFGYAAKGLLTKDVVYMTVSPEGRVTKEVWFEVPYYCMMHDFGATENYILLHIVPSTSSWERLEAGLPHFGFDTTKDVYLGVLPRQGTAKDLRWFKTTNLFASHVMNAFEDGNKLHFDTPVAKNNMFPFFPDIHGAPFNPMEAQSRLTRWTVDLSSNADAFKQTQLTDLVGEFPRIDERFAMTGYRYGFLLAADPARPGPMGNALGFVDLETGKKKWWSAPQGTSLQEPCFVPRTGSIKEGDGYIVQLAVRNEDNLADLLMFDAMHIDEGPIATMKLPVRLRFGLHGNWVPGEVMH